MFLYFMKGIWFDTLGIIVIALGIFGAGGSLGLYVQSWSRETPQTTRAIAIRIRAQAELFSMYLATYGIAFTDAQNDAFWSIGHTSATIDTRNRRKRKQGT